MKRFFAGFCVLTAFFIFSCSSEKETGKNAAPGFSAQPEGQETVVKAGQTVPDFEIETLDGTRIQIKELRGKVVWINLFATWCPPCNAEMPHLEAVWQKYKDRDFMILALAREETADIIRPFAQEKNLTFPLAPDEDRGVFSLFAKQNIPRNILVDKDGLILVESQGFNEEAFDLLVQKAVEALNK